MNKPSFRAWPLEASKPLPIYMSEELPGLPEYSEINRAVPQMPSGMKKEEECEHHLQRAIVTGLIIPTPEVHQIGDMAVYNRLYAPNYKVPRQLIHMQPFTMEQDIPDYDMDSEDEKWLAAHSKVMNVSALKFEEMMDRLEKNSGHSVVTQKEAEVLLKEDDDLIIAVYDYWLNKRLKTQQSLIPCIKTEVNRGNNNNPYLAFQRRTEKIQTRRIRKNDERTYEKMVKLKRDLSRALSLLVFVKRRESSKRELLQLTVDIFEKRYQAQDFNGQLLSEVSAMKASRPAFAPLFTNQYNHGTSWPKPIKLQDEYIRRKEKRQYKKRKHKNIHALLLNDTVGVASSGDDDSRVVSPMSPAVDDTPFTFRRKRQCLYHAPVSSGLGNWPWCSQQEGGLADQRYRFNITSIAHPTNRCVGLARRRVGRGGRVILDRAGPPMDDFWASLDFTIHDNCKEKAAVDDRILKDIAITSPIDDKSLLQASDSLLDWPHFRPKSPLVTEPEEEEPHKLLSNSSLSLAVEDLSDPSGSEYMPIELNLAELFPSLVWENTDSENTKEDQVPFTLTPPSEEDEQVSDTSFTNKARKIKQAVIDKKEYQSGSLLDRWARFESPPPEPAKKKVKPITPEPMLFQDKSGCSAFRTSNLWSDSKVDNISEPNTLVPAVIEDTTEPISSVVEDKPYLPPTPPKEVKTPSPPTTTAHRLNNLSGHTNGPVHSHLMNSGLLRKHIIPLASYRKKNNHVLSHGLNSKIIVRLPENTGEMLETTVVGSQVLSDEALLRKSTQVPMEVT